MTVENKTVKNDAELEEAAGSNKRPTDKTNTGNPSEKGTLESPPTGNAGGNHKRPADKSGELDDETGHEEEVNTSDTESKKLKDKGNEQHPDDIAEQDDEEKDDDDDSEDDGDDDEKKTSKMKSEDEVIDGINTDLSENSEFKIDEELGSLLESEDLSEEFQKKAKTVFESAVNEASKNHIEKLNEQYKDKFHEAINEYKEELDENVDKYLDYVVNEWVKENKLAIDEGIRTQNTESFMQGLAQLLEDHYVEVPEEKKDAYKTALEEKEEVEETLNSTIDSNIELKEELKEANKSLALERFTKNMTETQSEKIRSLAESVDFEDVDQFEGKLEVLKENYFPESNEHTKSNDDSITEDVQGDTPASEEETKAANPEMKQYVDTLSLHFGRV